MNKGIRFNITIVFAMCFTLFTLTVLGQNEKNKTVIALRELFDLADICHQTIKSYEASVRVADGAVEVSKNALLPDVNFSASVNYMGDAWMSDRDFSNGSNLDSPHFGNNFALEVSQVIFAGGAISNTIEATKLQSELAKLDLQHQRTQVRFLITGYYLNLYKYRNMLLVYEKNISSTEQIIKDMKAKEAEGVVLNNDITRYEVQLQNLLYKRTELLSAIEIYNNQLITTLDLPKTLEIMPDTTMLDAVTKHYSASELQGIAAVHSPIIKMAETNIDLSEKSLDIIKSGLLPKVSFMAADNFIGPITTMVPPVNSNLNIWYVGIGISYNVGKLYKTPAETSKGREAVSHAEMKFAETQEQVELNVHDAYVHYLNAFELLRTQEKSLQLANENYGVTENRYKNDLVLLIDLLDADDLRLNAEIQYENAKINIVYNYYKLLYVTGTL